MAGKTVIFLTGGTGYIGGAVFTALVQSFRTRKQEVAFRLLVRSNEKAAKVQAFAEKRGINDVAVVIGSLSDHEILKTEAANAHIVIHTANADDLGAAAALLDGLKQQVEKGQAPLLVHTSGTGLVRDKAAGNSTTDKIYHDDVDSEIASIPDSAPHRNVDLLLLAAGNQYPLDVVIIAPPTIWGLGTGPDLVHSQQIPWLIRSAISNKRAHHVGRGVNIWGQINIRDVADLYSLLMWKCVDEPGRHGGFYFAENGEFAWKQVSAAAQWGLVEAGFSVETESLDTQMEELPGVFGRGVMAAASIGGNSRCRGIKGKKLGWKPRRSEDRDFYEWITLEVSLLAKEK